MRQTFCAPEQPESAPFDDNLTPWRFGTQIRLPMEHWEAIVAFASQRDPADGQMLQRMAVLDSETISVNEQHRFVALLEALVVALPDAPPLTPEHSDPALIPEPMPNSQHVVMLQDVIAVIRLAQSMGQCFDSWVD